MRKEFDYQQDFTNTDFRQHPELYQVGRGEQGVLLVEPYKSEILPWWRYKDPESAQKSAEKIYALFEQYREKDDFVGMDMARKFIQMGYTRARRYANYKGGKKYDEKRELMPRGNDPVKAAAAAVFKTWWDRIRADEDYLRRKKAHQEKWG
ncbi:DUF4385 domain-containing protein [Franconibacter pulveris 1160]|uniref:Cytoplasmic protein n=2 Tax=Franconibacter TaxID=1649295 RepID=A0A0J8VJJ9_9ENTR|nr:MULTISPECIES: DUF4385 domain-containing protein [Franconibacter]KMV33351.1 cytoplasmic protein [Franconibacter pulveris]MCK1969908.1 DUF4385 domain-containing protein [Franconibacter sp. IITDAS19]MEB5923203.1 DUF4385 domain-containing protein [Franconibacter daqui]